LTQIPNVLADSEITIVSAAVGTSHGGDALRRYAFDWMEKRVHERLHDAGAITGLTCI